VTPELHPGPAGHPSSAASVCSSPDSSDSDYSGTDYAGTDYAGTDFSGTDYSQAEPIVAREPDAGPDVLAAHFELGARELVQAMVERTPNALYVMDARGHVQMWNAAAETLFGWTAEEVHGRRLPIVDASDGCDLDDRIEAVMAGAEFIGEEVTRRRKDGRSVELSTSTVPLSDGKGRIVAVFVISQDLTRTRRAEEAVLHHTAHDPLTELLNRRAFLEAVEVEVAKPGSHSMLVYVDIDDFGSVNDGHGHHTGDDILRHFADRLRHTVRPGSVLGRLGGDEFGVLLVDVPPRRVTAAVARILESVSGPYAVDGRRFTVRASAGVAPVHGAGRAEEALRRADMALYEAKRSARGGFRVFDSEIQRTVVQRVEVATAFERALADDELEIHYQPIVAVASGVLVGMEALVRWRRADGTWVPPAHFIPIVEQTGAINSLGDWVLERACSQLRRWADAAPVRAEGLVMSVNLSPRQLHDPSLVSRVRAALGRHGLTPGRLQLEVTETAITPDGPAAAAVLTQLRRLGVLLAIDDFGTGNSSLTLLRQMPFNALKVDRSFVTGIGTSAEDSAIVSATLGLAQSLGLLTTAEGVETPEQLAFLRAHGCDQAQGYLLGRPAPAEYRLPSVAAAPRAGPAA
jgi:diguanylate cyclase (GGDEF)-like protein/PAS domain S-box-containing protein